MIKFYVIIILYVVIGGFMRKRDYERLKFIPILIMIISVLVIGYNMVEKYQCPFDPYEESYDEMPYDYTEKKSSKESININTATREELEMLPGIGKATAEKILDLRFDVGRFCDVSELLYVDGISSEKFEAILPHITTDDE